MHQGYADAEVSLANIDVGVATWGGGAALVVKGPIGRAAKPAWTL